MPHAQWFTAILSGKFAAIRSTYESPLGVLPSGCDVVGFITKSVSFSGSGAAPAASLYKKIVSYLADSSSPQDVADLIHA